MEPTTNNQQQTPAIGEWHTANEADAAMAIETCIYENGNISKRCTLSDGKVAICHRLKGKDRTLIKRLAGDDKNKFEDALIAVSTKIDGKDIVMEDLDALWFNDAMQLQTMATTLNFT